MAVTSSTYKRLSGIKSLAYNGSNFEYVRSFYFRKLSFGSLQFLKWPLISDALLYFLTIGTIEQALMLSKDLPLNRILATW